MTHQHEEHHHHSSAESKRRIGIVAIWNLGFGAAEFALGWALHSNTLQMQGVHDMIDSGLYKTKSIAAGEHDISRRKRLRKLGAYSLLATGLSFGAVELAHELSDASAPDDLATPVAIAGGVLNIGAALYLHGHRNGENMRDSMQHAMFVDVPGSIITMVTVPMSEHYLMADAVGVAAHMALIGAVGISTLANINKEP